MIRGYLEWTLPSSLGITVFETGKSVKSLLMKPSQL